MKHMRLHVLLTSALLVTGCDDEDVDPSLVNPRPDGSFDDAASPMNPVDDTDAARDAWGAGDNAEAAVLPYARKVESFREGANAGFGRDAYPQVVLGPPKGKGTGAGGLDVLSLGVGGEIVLDLGERAIVDGPGPDFIVFENPFWPGGNAMSVFAELGEVSVSVDLTTWQTFPCSTQPITPGVFPGCAGWTPTLEFDPFAIGPLDSASTGGDAFDLAAVALSSARYVRIRDLSVSGQGSAAGFDLDAVGIVHPGP